MTSHPSPFHRQRQSNKSLDPTGQTAKFLYTILKQLDLKNIDWNEVADNLEITNGHAARMRWSRFRAQIEGLDNSYSRKGGRKKEGPKKRKKDREQDNSMKTEDTFHEGRQSKRIRIETGSGVKAEESIQSSMGVGSEIFGAIKSEPAERTTVIDGVTVHHPTMTMITVPETPPKPPKFSHNIDPALKSSLPSSITPTTTSSNQQINRPCSLSAPQPPRQWPQQYFNTSYGYPAYRTAGTASPYYGTPTTYINQYQFPNLYSSHPQQRFNHGPQPMSNQVLLQQQHMCNNSTSPATRTTNSGTAPPIGFGYQSQTPPQFRPPSVAQQKPFPLVKSQDPTQSQYQATRSTTAGASSQAQAYELAFQASYPWPYSEASLPKFLQQATASIDAVPVADNTNNTESTTSNTQQHQSQARITETSGPEIVNHSQGDGSTAGQEPAAVQNQGDHGRELAERKVCTELLSTGEKTGAAVQAEEHDRMCDTVPIIKQEPEIHIINLG